MDRAPSYDPPDRPTTPDATPQPVVLNACSSYELLSIISLDPLGANLLASGNFAIKSLGKMYRLIVLVEGLSYSGWGLSGYNLVHYRCGYDRSKYVDRFLVQVLVCGRDRSRVEWAPHLFPEHLDDSQNTLSLRGVKVGGVSIRL